MSLPFEVSILVSHVSQVKRKSVTKPQETLVFKRKRLTKEEVRKVCDDHVREVGRPSRMDDPVFRDWVCDKVVELGQEGWSPAEISAEIKVDRLTMLSWEDRFPEFSTAMMRAKQLEQAWWERQSRENLKNRDFNANLWLKSAIFRFKDYADQNRAHKLEISGRVDQNIEINHNILMDTTRRVMQILEDGAQAAQLIEGEATELLPPPEKD